MKLLTLEKVLACMKTLATRIELPQAILDRGLPIEWMLETLAR